MNSSHEHELALARTNLQPTARKGVLHLHVVEARGLRRAPGSGHSGPPHGFSISMAVGALGSCGHPALACSTGAPLSVAAGQDTALWNSEVALAFPNADHWLWLRATTDDSASTEERRTSLTRSRSGLVACAAGEVRMPIKEYESGEFHDLWITFRRAPATHAHQHDRDAPTDYVAGQIHLRFMYQLASVPANGAASGPDQSHLSSLPPALGGFVAHLLHGSAFWLQALLAFLDSRSSASGGGDSAAKSRELVSLLQAVLTLLAHTRFSLLLSVLESVVLRELAFLAEQQSGRVDSVWASNLFRRNSVAAKLLAMYCLDNAAASSASTASSATPAAITAAREGVGKPYLVSLLSPFVAQVVRDVSGGTVFDSQAGGVHTNYFAADTPNPYEIDPAKLGGNAQLLARNQTLLVERCQALLDAVLASNDDDPAALPTVPHSIKWVARSIKRCVCDYVAQSAMTTTSARQNADAAAGAAAAAVSAAIVPLIRVESDDPAEIAAAAAATAATRAQIAHESAHNSLASLFFLRFLCPALVTPVHYGLLARPPPAAASRALILLAKALQSLVNSAGSVSSAAAARNSTPPITLPTAATPSSAVSTAPHTPDDTLSDELPTFSGREREIYKGQASSAPPVSLTALALAGDSTTDAFTAPAPAAAAVAVPAPTSPDSFATSPSSQARLFKEPYMEMFYPWINSNIGRVSCFLDALGVLGAQEARELRPGIEETPLQINCVPTPSSTAADAHAAQRELERAGWTLHAFAKQNLGGLCAAASRMLAASSYPHTPLPRTTPGQVFSGAAAMHDLTRPHRSEARLGAPPPPTASAPSSPSSAHSGTALEHTPASVLLFVARFRHQVEAAVPPALDARGGLAGPVICHHSASPSPRKGATASAPSSTLSSPASSGSSGGLSSAASTGLKFFQRVKDAMAPKDKERERERERAAAAAASPPLHPPIPIEGMAPASSCSSDAARESDAALQLFKQTSVEVQLRLSQQLEESEARFAALQRAYDELEAKALAKDDLIVDLRSQLHLALAAGQDS